MGENEIPVVFRHLARRLRRENDLSDVTWAVVQTVPALGRDICRFFGVAVAPEYPLNVHREYPIGSGYHVDVAFVTRDRILLLENKLWDQQYHLEEYAETTRTQEEASLALISNHRLASSALELASQHRWQVKYWEDLLDFLCKQNYVEYQPLVEGYLAYVKGVCDLATIGLIRLEDSTLHSLRDLNILIKRVIESSGDAVGCKLYTSNPRGYGPSWSGWNYSLEKTHFGKPAWPLFGVDFTEAACICITLDEDWNPQIVPKLRPLVGSRDEVCEIGEYGDGIGFTLLADRYRSLNSLDREAQKKELEDFFLHVNRTYLGSSARHEGG